MTPEVLALLVDAGLDAMNVDVKGTAEAVRKYCKGVDVEKVWRICTLTSARGVHLELTTLVIPTVNDSDVALSEIAQRIARDLGADVPWHVSRYYPAYRFSVPCTPLATLERAWHSGRDAGLDFVYIGNVPSLRYNNTYCPSCGMLLIERRGYHVTLPTLRSGHCPGCAKAVAGVWR
jgi:pyruvate formate lyase activating enzyme